MPTHDFDNTSINDPQNREAKPVIECANRTTKDLFSLTGRTIMIAGTMTPLTAAIATAALEMGSDIMFVSHLLQPEPELWDGIQDIARSYGTRAWHETYNVKEVAAVARLFEENQDTRFPLRGLIICSYNVPFGSSIDCPSYLIKKMMHLNVVIAHTFAQEAAKEFRRRGMSGSVILLSTACADSLRNELRCSAYRSSRAALIELAKSLAAEWGSYVGCPLIRVNTLSVGDVVLSEQRWENRRQANFRGYDRNLMMRPSAVGEHRGPAVFLLSDASSFVTGTDVQVDGGRLARW